MAHRPKVYDPRGVRLIPTERFPNCTDIISELYSEELAAVCRSTQKHTHVTVELTEDTQLEASELDV